MSKQISITSLIEKPVTNELSALSAKKIQQKSVSGSLSESQDVQKKTSIASQLMLSGKFELSIQAYKRIAKQYPHVTEECETQIGAALYFLGRYDESMVYFNKYNANDVEK
ncbi:hypothetical protein MNBD_GAMMA12-3258 [hydrothermal vent metagenome]|uniref:Tetratricopeptide repeat protein n=1 Tax=hydrothermal vent metagenome TaxID=652676 RepID=A0A3B0YKX2_9ZZZZ